MGNKFCKNDVLGGGQKLFDEILDFISCDAKDDDDEGEMRADKSAQLGYPAVKPSYTGLAGGSNPGSPIRAPPANAPQQALPGESCVVTYDVMGESARMATPGQSVVVTSSMLGPAGPRKRSFVEQSPTLVPTKSFDVAAPYKIGDQVEIWSLSNQAWCRGSVEKGKDGFIHITYKSASGQMISKVMPNGHEHVRFHGQPWQGNSNAAPQSVLLPTAMPSSPGVPRTGSRGSPPQMAPWISTLPSSPTSAAGTYKVGDELELFSASQNTWCPGTVHKVDGEWITISYKTAAGQPMTKIMPNGHEQLRRAEKAPPLNQNESRPPPPPTRPYKTGDAIEIFSTSQNAWCKGQVSKVDGEYVHITYGGPGGQPMNKIMPNGHAQLRLLSAT